MELTSFEEIDYDEEESEVLKKIQILLQNGADIHADNDYVLRLAKRDNKEEIVNFLIEFDKE